MLKDYETYLTLQPKSGQRQPLDEQFSGHKWKQIYRIKTVYRDLIINALEQGEADLQTGDGYLIDFDIQPERAYTDLTLTYSSVNSAGGLSLTHTLNEPQYFLTWVQDDIPVERLANYKAFWNNCLATNADTDEVVGWALAKSDTSLTKTEAEHYRWCKDAAQMPEGWRVRLYPVAKKRGLDSKMNFRPTVRKITWCASYKDTLDYAVLRMQRLAPRTTYGLPSTDTLWLACPSDISPEGTLYRVETLFIYSSDGWDEDIYPT